MNWFRSYPVIPHSLCLASLMVACAFVCDAAAQTQKTFLTAAVYAQQPPDKAEDTPHLMTSPEVQGDVLMARQRYVAALDAYRQGSMDSATIWNKMGIANHHMFNLREAQRDYEQALKLKPAYPEAMNNLGAVYYGLKNYKQAERTYKKALKMNPHSATFYCNLGTAYLAQGKYKKSADAYRMAITIDPNVFESDPSTKIAEIGPTREMAALNYLLAKTLAQAGKKNEALVYLRKALNEGFSDRKKMMEDKELASLHDMPEFQRMMAERQD